MSKVQHKLAHQLLSIIRDANATHRLLTYQTAAEALGRPIDHARAIAQVCDLLDAAAAVAGTPLLALVAVSAASGDINPKAWVKGTPAGDRDKVIKCSLGHTFTDHDFEAIEEALISLKDYGNRAAWEKVRETIPYNRLLQILTKTNHNASQDAIDDLDVGSDNPEKKPTTGSRYARDPKVRSRVLDRAEGHCELCGVRGFSLRKGNYYVETHHIIALAKDGADRETNVIGLCANHHREAHFGALSDELEKELIVKVEERQRLSVHKGHGKNNGN